jgi:tRNA A58 N-methylase Trm61
MPFTEVEAGDMVIELGVGSGYITELLSWLIGGSRRAFAHIL